ncbi:hypothetical protein [Vibrio europaeus]|uniref:hypothetical protein n=1 Tax=Vibrio europaeus TaxID=300876 RepID=UPI00233E7C1B|nr:hypothetical protein [Vibrio europaeus]MDC5753529.1 hypothetical protein [Vibrio europaeus]MDC5816558.1 hypothetical protein [Vibrio europaeus]
MTDHIPYILYLKNMPLLGWAILVACLFLADRIIGGRSKVKLLDLGLHSNYLGYRKFSVSFDSKCNLKSHRIEYHLQNTDDPKVVIAGKSRSMSTSEKGKNRETLLINKKLIKPGKWLLVVEVIQDRHPLNPFYSLCPVTNKITKEFHL